MAQQLTRQALFDLVWQTPMKQLAVEFGVTPQAVSKLCEDHEIPKPGYGYWTLRDMGRPVEKPTLSVATREANELINIEPKRPPALQLASSEPTADAQNSNQEPPLISVGSDAPLDAELGAPDRQVQFLASLTEAIAARGWSGKLRKAPYKITVEDEPLTFELTEQTDRIAHVQTAKEIAALRKFEDDRVRAARTGRWFSEWERPKIAEWDHVPNGKLTLKFEAGYHHHGLRRSFSDGKRQRLEDLIGTITDAFAAYAQGEKEHRAEVERRRLEAIEDEKRRRENERRHALEKKRLEFLGLQMDRFDEAARIEFFVAAYPDAGRNDEKIASLLDWALGRAERLRAEFAPARLRAKLDRNDLMNDATSDGVAWRPVE